MIVFEVPRGRRLIGFVEQGASLRQSLVALMRDHQVKAATVSASGKLSMSENGPGHEIVFLRGSLFERPDDARGAGDGDGDGLELTALLQANTGVLWAGRIEDATSEGVEVVVEDLSGVPIRRAIDAEGRIRWEDTPSATTWDQIMALSEGTEPSPTSGPALPARAPRVSDAMLFDEPIPEVGDFVEHSKFGRCLVDAVHDDESLVIRQESGVRRTIRIDYMKVVSTKYEGERRILVLQPRKPR